VYDRATRADRLADPRTPATIMTVGAAPLFGALAAVVGVVGMVPYIRDTLRGSTRPQFVTWLIWTVLAVVVCASQAADGASWSLLVAGAHAALNGAVAVLALRRSVGFAARQDAVVIVLAGFGLIGWLVSGEPIVATLCVIAADLVGLAAMTPKAYRQPWSETLSTYVFASVGGVLAAASVASIDLSLLAYPVYYSIANGAMAALIAHSRRVPMPAVGVAPLPPSGLGRGDGERARSTRAAGSPAAVSSGRQAGRRGDGWTSASRRESSWPG